MVTLSRAKLKYANVFEVVTVSNLKGITIKINKEDYVKLKIKCIQEKITINKKLNNLISDYLDNKIKIDLLIIYPLLPDFKLITVRMEEKLHFELKLRCARDNVSITNIIRDLTVIYNKN